MSGPSQVTNPQGANLTVSDFKLFRDASSQDLELGKGETYTARANATILKGQALEHVVPTTTVPYSVQPMQLASGVHLYAGCALNSATAGQDVNFARRGYMMAFTDDADTPAFGQVLLKPSATIGQYRTAAAAATSTGQAILGVVLGAEQDGVALRKSPVFLDPAVGTTNPLT